MPNLAEQIREALSMFASNDTGPALIGGLAVVAHQVIRATVENTSTGGCNGRMASRRIFFQHRQHLLRPGDGAFFVEDAFFQDHVLDVRLAGRGAIIAEVARFDGAVDL